MADRLVTRFAPSPTGYLHIGGARTALFNWAFARRHGGKFILRIEDTDAARSSAQSTRCIIEDLRWLGLEWDEGPDPDAPDVYATQIGDLGPYFQSQRHALYQDYLQRLAQAGRAYRCFKSAEQLKAEREAQKAAGEPMKYDPAQALSRSEADQRRLMDQRQPFVWRFRMPDTAVTVPDLVLGNVTIQAQELEDFVIVKSDGGPTFHFANVVDDATMQTTHVLRGQEHLMNTPKHVAMFQALGIQAPRYAHMPLIFNPDGTKLGKRDKAKAARQAAQAWLKQHGGRREELLGLVHTHQRELSAEELAAFLDKKSDDNAIATPLAAALGVALPEIDVHDFRASGYLKDVLLNYVTLLGWSPGGNLERFDLDYLRQEFDLERLGKSNARFDRVKLLAFNAETLQKMEPGEYRLRLGEHLRTFHPEFAELAADEARFALFAAAYQPRTRILSDPAKAGRFLVVPDEQLAYDPKAVQKVLLEDQGSGLTVLRLALVTLESISEWQPAALHQAIQDLATQSGKGVNDVAQPLRVAVSGGTVSPPIHDTLAILGRESTRRRVQQCLTRHSG